MKKIIAFIVIIFLIVLGVFGYIFFTSQPKDIETGGIFENIKNFFPFGNTAVDTQSPGTPTDNQDNPTEPQVKIKERMYQISDAPVAGYTSYLIATTTKTLGEATSTKSTSTLVRFVERATGHIYEYDIKTQEKKRLSNTTLPKVYEAILNPKSNDVVLRFLDTTNAIVTIHTTITASSTVATSTTPFPLNTQVVTNNKDRLAWSIRKTDSSTVYSSDFSRKKPTELFTTSLRDIQLVWAGNTTLAYFNKPASDQGGILFFVNTLTGKVSKIASGINGLAPLINTDATAFVYNTDTQALRLSIRNITKNTDTPINLSTLPEKCVWGTKNKTTLYCAAPLSIIQTGYPEAWYKSTVSFSDTFWKIDALTGQASVLYNPLTDSKPTPDTLSITLNEDETELLFINKKDLTLWGITL